MKWPIARGRTLFARLRARAARAPDALGPGRRGWMEDRAIQADQRTAWIERGLVVLPGVYQDDAIERYNRRVAAVRCDVEEGKNAHGYGDRIGQLHHKEPELLELASSPRVLRFLRWAFGDDPAVFGSLNFERGTQQDAHVDAIFFITDPVYSMAGVWVALEDIHPDSGPLFYIPGSHRWPFRYSDEVIKSRADLAAARLAVRRGEGSAAHRQELANQIAGAWSTNFAADLRAQAVEPVSLSLHRGDVVVWHALLAHGGGTQRDVSLSRKSVVFHYVGRHARFFVMQDFCFHDRAEIAQLPGVANSFVTDRAVPYIRYPYFVTYKDGREIVHSLI